MTDHERPFPGNKTRYSEVLGGEYNGAHDEKALADLSRANLLTSELDLPNVPGIPAFHRPVLDLDMECTLVPSSTPGKFHLYINRAMPWPQYAALLTALGEALILEPGYVSACLNRGYSAVRLPWIKKGKEG